MCSCASLLKEASPLLQVLIEVPTYITLDYPARVMHATLGGGGLGGGGGKGGRS